MELAQAARQFRRRAHQAIEAHVYARHLPHQICYQVMAHISALEKDQQICADAAVDLNKKFLKMRQCAQSWSMHLHFQDFKARHVLWKCEWHHSANGNIRHVQSAAVIVGYAEGRLTECFRKVRKHSSIQALCLWYIQPLKALHVPQQLTNSTGEEFLGDYFSAAAFQRHQLELHHVFHPPSGPLQKGSAHDLCTQST